MDRLLFSIGLLSCSLGLYLRYKKKIRIPLIVDIIVIILVVMSLWWYVFF